MNLAKVVDGVVIKYPAKLKDGNWPGDVPDELGRRPHIGHPLSPTAEYLATGNLVRVKRSEKPTDADVVERPVPVIDPTAAVETWVEHYPTREFTLEELERYKDGAKFGVDQAAERRRSKYITPGEGQAMTYLEKARQAELVIAGETNPEAVPLVNARATARGVYLLDAAGEILETRYQWNAIAAGIETAREAAKAAIDEATDRAGVDQASAVTWPA